MEVDQHRCAHGPISAVVNVQALAWPGGVRQVAGPDDVAPAGQERAAHNARPRALGRSHDAQRVVPRKARRTITTSPAPASTARPKTALPARVLTSPSAKAIVVHAASHSPTMNGSSLTNRGRATLPAVRALAAS